MKVCVLQSVYEGVSVAHGNLDPPRELTHLLPGDEVAHVFLRKATTFKQLQTLKRQNFDIFVNLCEGYLDWEVPSIDVIHALTSLGLPFTGATADLYDPLVSDMKLAAYAAGVASPRWALATTPDHVAKAASSLGFPLFLKPNRGGDSRGIDLASRCETEAALHAKAAELLPEFDEVIIEEFIDGREFSVLVAADLKPELKPAAFLPMEFVFPEGYRFKSYDLKQRQHHPGRNVPCGEPALASELQSAARDIFTAFNGVGACRMDFRLDHEGKPNLLDANFAFSVFYPEGVEATADYILRHDPRGASWFLRHLINEGLARHAARRPAFAVKGDGIAGYGIHAIRDIASGEILFPGEHRFHRLVTRRHAFATWPAHELHQLKQYAIPLGEEVFITWDDKPRNWFPQNHSCDANTGYVGLDVRALRAVPAGEELTLDYGALYGADMEPFECRCGALSCRGIIRGVAGNTIDRRERLARDG